MADARRFEIDDLVNRPGTYVNPQTEVVIVVDDSATLDAELFAEDDAADGEWLLVSDDAPLDESRRDELLDRLQRRARRSQGGATPLEGGDEDDDHVGDDEDNLQAAGFDDPAAYDEDDDR